LIYLLLNNQKIRDVIDTITSKLVLILGRFTPERKIVLDAIRDELRKRSYLPVLFDFEKPSNRDVTKTVSTTGSYGPIRDRRHYGCEEHPPEADADRPGPSVRSDSAALAGLTTRVRDIRALQTIPLGTRAARIQRIDEPGDSKKLYKRTPCAGVSECGHCPPLVREQEPKWGKTRPMA
jgi:hypothetical protein